MSKVRLQCLDIRCHEEVGMEMNPKLCTHLHTPRSPATGRQSWGSLSSLQPSGEENLTWLLLPTPSSSSWCLSWEGAWEAPPLSSEGLGLTAGRPWAQTQAGTAFPAASTPWTPGTGYQALVAPALVPPN